MGRSVSYLRNAEKVNYFNWPMMEAYNEETDECLETNEYEEADWVIESIQENFICEFPEFDRANEWGGREDHIILKGYGLEIGLSEYCGLASLSVRINEKELEYCDTDQEYQEARDQALSWIHDHWDEASKHWNLYRKIGSFSNGEGVFEKVN